MLEELISDFKIENKEEVLKILKTIKKDKLYRSNIHGLYHSEKVLLFAYLIAKNERLNDIDLKIITDAAMYHDVGRIDDSEEAFHGYRSAEMIDEIVDDEIYKDKNNLKILKAIIDAHSRKDELCKNSFESFEIDEKEYDRYYKLYCILKDADALDRLRLSSDKTIGLNEEYLRVRYSRKLIGLSREINKKYRYLMMEPYLEKYRKIYNVDEPKKGCFHSVGFNIFNFKSVLKNGILSHHAKEMNNIPCIRNYFGSNGNFWISVIDDEILKLDTVAYNKFIKNGIVFYSLVDKLCESTTDIEKAKKEYLPYRQASYYEEERYAFEKIGVDQIQYIILSKETKDLDVIHANYIGYSLNYYFIEANVNNIIKQLRQDYDYNINYSIVYKLLRELYMKFDEYEKNKYNDYTKEYKKYSMERDTLLYQLNILIGRYMEDIFSKKLNKKNIKVIDVVFDILNELNIPYNVDNPDEVIITLNSRKKVR